MLQSILTQSIYDQKQSGQFQYTEALICNKTQAHILLGFCWYKNLLGFLK